MTRHKHCRKDKNFLVNFRCRGERTILNALRVALRIISGKIILYFAFVALCGALQTHFHGRGLETNSLSQSLTALTAPSGREPLARPDALRFSLKLYRHAKGPIPEGAVAVGDWGSSPPQKKAARQLADSLFQKKIRKTRAQKGRVSIRTYFRPCSARCARTAPTRLRSRRGRRCAPDT